MKTKFHKTINFNVIQVTFGWFSGEPFKLFSLTICEELEELAFVVLDFQCTRICFSIAIYYKA